MAGAAVLREIRDGYQGCGAIDMKDTGGRQLATARHFTRTGTRPAPRDRPHFLADEEAGGRIDAHWLVEHRPELFAGVTEAIGEGGGFSYAPRRHPAPVPDRERLARHGVDGADGVGRAGTAPPRTTRTPSPTFAESPHPHRPDTFPGSG